MQQDTLVQILYSLQTTPLKPLGEFFKFLLNGISFVSYAQKFLLMDNLAFKA
ncbi:hypothetical protein HPSA_03370 [Helicobacter pylori SouthAfrica7]|uniref:Uncharacterized protein n=1 Tax=Helicobacter pylori (strain SouthAfrica7) TaxID=907239 RepID=E8QW52_HELPW|nr:hypothetical protein HPSA_03370 [Helicobacter pylori SouthAfrica7]